MCWLNSRASCILCDVGKCTHTNTAKCFAWKLSCYDEIEFGQSMLMINGLKNICFHLKYINNIMSFYGAGHYWNSIFLFLECVCVRELWSCVCCCAPTKCMFCDLWDANKGNWYDVDSWFWFRKPQRAIDFNKISF